ncbi:hypothetical protein ONZ51_g7277 [Trametes cubensis]|uniref:Uncharacterized protein n=1 Tax=Trametes cubensis TaxID=1111947 RepID=A0AAD7TQW2_9APHY|nr:hypothetical protein ONZ51_g7277 [Trametes cubensis]
MENGPLESVRYGKCLLMTLSHAVDRMTQLSASAQISVIVAALVQRLRLEAEANAQLFRRIGLPVWFLQPLTGSLKVWKIVTPVVPPSGMSRALCNPPILHDTSVMVGVVNLTHNWLRDAKMGISKLVSGSRLPTLAPSEVAQVLAATDDTRAAKRRKIQPTEPESSGSLRRAIVQPVVPPVEETKEKRRRRKRSKRTADPKLEVDAKSDGGSSTSAPNMPPLQADPPQPAREFLASPFCTIPPHWARALKAASPVPRSAASAVFFYPPPFLLDTVSQDAPPPQHVPEGAAVRPDGKVVRYLHNLVRIRRFCRARLFDASMSNQPLTLTEWRAALFGDYKTSQVNGSSTPKTSGSLPPDRKPRGLRRQEERDAISRLLSRVAFLPSYAEDMVFQLDDRLVSRETVRTDPRIRQRLLWESHETNFRCELMALDTLLVQRENWTELNRWEREREVSGVWGDPSSTLGVLPPDAPPGPTTHIWGSLDLSEWRDAVPVLCHFLKIFARWPQYPDVLFDAIHRVSSWTESEFRQLLDVSVDFYVRTFVQVYHRLPIPPIPPPPKSA